MTRKKKVAIGTVVALSTILVVGAASPVGEAARRYYMIVRSRWCYSRLARAITAAVANSGLRWLSSIRESSLANARSSWSLLLPAGFLLSDLENCTFGFSGGLFPS